MLIVQSFPKTDKSDQTNNYFRVVQKNSRENYVFTFASTSPTEARWAFAEAHRLYDELGGAFSGFSVTIWRKHPDFKTLEIGSVEPDVSMARKLSERKPERKAEGVTPTHAETEPERVFDN